MEEKPINLLGKPVSVFAAEEFSLGQLLSNPFRVIIPSMKKREVSTLEDAGERIRNAATGLPG